MSKLLRQNVGGTDYTIAGCALSATCATAAATAAKVAELTDGDVLADGMSVAVQFTNGNTAASPLTLTVGGVTANICDSRGQNIGGNIWQAGNVVTLLYTFGKFLLLNCVVDEVTLNNMNSVSSNAVANILTDIDGTITATLENDVELKYTICKRIISDYYFVNFALKLISVPTDYNTGQIKISTHGFKLDGKNIIGVLAGKLYAKDADNTTFTAAATYDTSGEWVFFGPQHDLSMTATTIDDFTSKLSGIVKII